VISVSGYRLPVSSLKVTLHGPPTDITPDTMISGNTHVYQTAPFTGAEQLVLTLITFPPTDTLPMFVDFSGESPGFIFNPGKNPEVGQKWEWIILNAINLSRKHLYHLRRSWISSLK